MDRRGRPEKFSAGFVRAFKAVVREHGLLKGHKLINQNGVTVAGGKGGSVHHSVKISLPTLAKYVKREGQGGKAVTLRQGRPVAKVA